MARTSRCISAVLLAPLALGTAVAQDTRFGFREESVELADGPLAGRTVRYRLRVPDDIDAGERLPVILFLHGAGERGDDNRSQLRHFPEHYANAEFATRYRAIVVAPQCPRRGMWIGIERTASGRRAAMAPNLEIAMAALRRTLDEEACDPDRVYLTGLSMGGYGSWILGCEHPELFAAMIPVCGGGDPERAGALRELPIWAWHGSADRTVAASQSRAMVDALREAGGSCHYTELPGVGHNSWRQTYRLGGALDWLLAQRRGEPYFGRILACEQSEHRLAMLDVGAPWTEDAITWSWSARDDAGLPEAHREWFDNPTDCKPIERGTAVVATASGGGMFVVRIADRRVMFHAYVGGNPHSVAALPDGSYVVASSTGNRLSHIVPDRHDNPQDDPAATIELKDAHGVHWAEASQRLWALGGDELVAFAYADGKLREVQRTRLPGERRGGHDLAPRGDGTLLVTGVRDVWRFDPRDFEFEPLKPVADTANCKSINSLRPGGPLVLMVATESWCSDRARFVGADLERRLPGARFYKLRPWP